MMKTEIIIFRIESNLKAAFKMMFDLVNYIIGGYFPKFERTKSEIPRNISLKFQFYFMI